MTADLTTRPLAATDAPLLTQATLDNLNWSGMRFTAHDLEHGPEFAHYTHLVPERGDFGVVAERRGETVGVGWALFLPATEPGYGFLDEATPEVSLWVRQDTRRRGVGRTLLRRLQQEARERGVAGLTLSVETGNDARRLYAAEGFTPVAGREHDGVMVWVA